MSWTQSDADALKASIATGVRDVTYSDGSRTVYRSLDEMRQVLALIEGEVAAASAAPRARTIRLTSCKGF